MMIYVVGVISMIVLSVVQSDWLKTATDLQVWCAFVGFTWIFAGLAAVHMARLPPRKWPQPPSDEIWLTLTDGRRIFIGKRIQHHDPS